MLKEIIDGINLSIFLILILTFIIALPVYLYGKSFETKYFPVVVNVETQLLSYDRRDNIARYTQTFQKKRACAPLKSTFAWYTINSFGEQERMVFRDNIANDVSLPKGLNRTYIEVAGYRPEGQFVSQKLIMTHQCHFLWSTDTVVDVPISSSDLEAIAGKR